MSTRSILTNFQIIIWNNKHTLVTGRAQTLFLQKPRSLTVLSKEQIAVYGPIAINKMDHKRGGGQALEA